MTTIAFFCALWLILVLEIRCLEHYWCHKPWSWKLSRLQYAALAVVVFWFVDGVFAQVGLHLLRLFGQTSNRRIDECNLVLVLMVVFAGFASESSMMLGSSPPFLESDMANLMGALFFAALAAALLVRSTWTRKSLSQVERPAVLQSRCVSTGYTRTRRHLFRPHCHHDSLAECRHRQTTQPNQITVEGSIMANLLAAGFFAVLACMVFGLIACFCPLGRHGAAPHPQFASHFFPWGFLHCISPRLFLRELLRCFSLSLPSSLPMSLGADSNHPFSFPLENHNVQFTKIAPFMKSSRGLLKQRCGRTTPNPAFAIT